MEVLHHRLTGQDYQAWWAGGVMANQSVRLVGSVRRSAERFGPDPFVFWFRRRAAGLVVDLPKVVPAAALEGCVGGLRLGLGFDVGLVHLARDASRYSCLNLWTLFSVGAGGGLRVGTRA